MNPCCANQRVVSSAASALYEQLQLDLVVRYSVYNCFHL
jgi:hypothetical protein